MRESRAVTCLLDISLPEHAVLVEYTEKFIDFCLQEFFLTNVNRIDLHNGEQVTITTTGGPNHDLVISLRNSPKLVQFQLDCSSAVQVKSLTSRDRHELNDDLCDALQRLVIQQLGDQVKVVAIPPVKRGCEVPVYFPLSDGRIAEYDFDKVIVDTQSKYQNIKILHSKTLGNVLLLDDAVNLGECDLVYTQALMWYGQLSYEGKEVLILGGGDGALLHELLKENPKHVTMIDIDGEVMRVCALHMRSVCGSTLDQFKGSNYEIMVEDCIVKLKDFIQKGSKFDIIFNDLTDIPLDGNQGQCELWKFIKQILYLSFQCLRRDGVYLNHAIGVTCTDTLQEYERVLNALPFPVKFEQKVKWVPSFLEKWTFYKIWFDYSHLPKRICISL